MEGKTPLEVFRATTARLLAEGAEPIVEQPTFEALEARARELGTEYGRAAALWFFDGNTDADTYRRVLEGLEEGDPEILESIPSSPLSGEWADGLTMGRLLEELGVEDPHAELSFNAEPWDSIADVFCDAYSAAAVEEVERVARLHAWTSVADDARYALGGVAWRIVSQSPDGETVRAVMIGDDQVHELFRSELEEIAREEYCGECGQIGCGHDGWDRS